MNNNQRPNIDLIARNQEYNFPKLSPLWSLKNAGSTAVCSFFSLIIPEGEMYFIRSVQAYTHAITDAQLETKVKTFSQQEGFHAKQHRNFNQALKDINIDTDLVEAKAKSRFRAMEKFLPKKLNLSATVYAEHITALISDTVFSFPEMMQDLDPEVNAFWTWHAAEELEHKAVAFEVLQSIGGGYFTRILGALIINLFIAYNLPLFYRQFKNYYTPEVKQNSRPMADFFAMYPGLKKRLYKTIFKFLVDYFKLGFHPNTINHSDYIKSWRLQQSNQQE